ncbi:MAG: M48 family metallopeptidase [Candidatus Kapaibacterium sp.]|nr:M48 family metallopeptidase [Bacteroidota bacterium]
MITIESVKPGISWQMVVSFIVASLVFTFWLFLLYADIFLILQYLNIFAIIGSVICTMLLVTLRPRISKPPQKYMSKSDAPILFSIIEDICSELSASTIDYVILNHEHNASMGYRGIAQKRVLTLGYPLLLVLDSQETVELISHELAHNINRDPMRGYIQWYAASSLERWYYITYPDEIITTNAGIYALIFSVPMNLLMWCISQMFLGLTNLLYWLMWRDSQRAEYYADYLAMTMSGNACCETFFRKLMYNSELQLAAQRAVLAKRYDAVFEYFIEAVNNIPETEIKRIQCVNMLYESRVDSSHPPTPYRIGFAKSKGIIPPKYHLKDYKHQQLLEELKKFEKEISLKLADEFRNSVYRR